ncbi:HCP-like protein [Backusella circina FSU 941]|nr:HCP-like protein [Backusella circina FSU 941]
MTIMKAREGNEKDLLKIGYAYYSRHTRNDYLKALDWFIKSAEKNSAEAEFRIAELYYKGQGVEKDHGKSFEWCLRAAKKGHIDALNRMGWSYLEGWGVTSDKQRAIYWFTKAADQGDWIAQEQLDSLKEDDASFSNDVHIEFTDEDYRLDIPQEEEEKEEEEEEEIDLPMEMSEDKVAELKEIMLKYQKLQQELEDEKKRRDEEIAKRDEEMKYMAKAIEVLQSSMSDAAIDGDNQTHPFTNGAHSSIAFLSIDKANGQSLEHSTDAYTHCDAIVKTSKNMYCDSPLEDTSDWKSEDGQDPNYDTPEEEEEEGQDPNYDSPTDDDEQDEKEKQDLNYDSPDEELKSSTRYSTLPARSESTLQVNRSNTL